MDGAPNFNLGNTNNKPPSDHPTPSTIDSSSNTSYQRTGHPSPNFNLGNTNNKPPSDHPTPSTIDSSSNTSYQRTGHPSPQKSQQQPSTTQAPLNPLGISSTAAAATDGGNTDPNQFNDPSSLARQLSSNHPVAPFYSTGADTTSFSISSPSTWDFTNPPAQVPVSNPGGMAPGTTGPFSEAQLAQILSATSWDAWRS